MSRDDWIQTFTGRPYFPAAPNSRDIDIRDIAHSLSQLCRFGGHCSAFYSVAEHSVLVSQVVPPEHALAALMHDATEAYVIDVPRPLKMMLQGYAELEERAWHAICERFDLDPELHSCIKHADNSVLLAEKAQLLGPSPMEWGSWTKDVVPADVEVRCLHPHEAREAFMARWIELRGCGYQ